MEATRRQERGKRRIESILDAASEVFADAGYEGATTNRIAAEAGISPGSLYQFFPNKAAIAEALTARYVAGWDQTYTAALSPALGRRPLPQVVDQVVDALVAFHVAHRGAKALLAGADVSPELAAVTESLHAAMCDRVEDLIAGLAPALPAADRARSAEVTVQIVKAILPLVLAAAPAERGPVVAELKRALTGYLGATAES
jgi:AcrR family transcriptional regulator